eukprot:11542273-Alexandrium_andersonii.AAC.1
MPPWPPIASLHLLDEVDSLVQRHREDRPPADRSRNGPRLQAAHARAPPRACKLQSEPLQ